MCCLDYSFSSLVFICSPQVLIFSSTGMHKVDRTNLLLHFLTIVMINHKSILNGYDKNLANGQQRRMLIKPVAIVYRSDCINNF